MTTRAAAPGRRCIAVFGEPSLPPGCHRRAAVKVFGGQLLRLPRLGDSGRPQAVAAYHDTQALPGPAVFPQSGSGFAIAKAVQSLYTVSAGGGGCNHDVSSSSSH